jgi:predicted secreted protein
VTDKASLPLSADTCSGVPPEIGRLLGGRPIIHGESPKDYDALLMRLAEAMRPNDFVEWLWVKDAADLTWDTFRARRARGEMLEVSFGQAVRDDILSVRSRLAEEVDYASGKMSKPLRACLEALGAFASECRNRLPDDWRQRVPELLAKCGTRFDEQAIWAKAQLDARSRLEPLDRHIAALDSARDKVVRELERRRETIARRYRMVSDELVQENGRLPGSLGTADQGDSGRG